MRSTVWLFGLFCFSCADVELATQQPLRGEISYWSEGVDQFVVDDAARQMSVMGWRFNRVAKKSQADITVELSDCSDPKTIGHTNPCGEILFCRGQLQRPAFFCHEFGHALGSPHIEGGPAIMNASTDQDYFTELDVEAFNEGGYGLSIFNCE
jgi:hypothetical protein